MEKWLGKNLFFLRKLRWLKQYEMQSELDIKATTWGMYEANKSQPNLDVLIRISKYFGVTESDLLHTDLETNAHLIKNEQGGKKQEKAHPNAHAIAHPTTKKGADIYDLSGNEKPFSQALNEDKPAYDRLARQLAQLSSKMVTLEDNMTTRITQLEEKVNAITGVQPKKGA